MSIQLLYKKAKAFLPLLLSLFIIAAVPARADTMSDWFTKVQDAFEEPDDENADDEPAAVPAQTAVPPASLGGEQSAGAYVQNRIIATGAVQNSDGYEFIVSSAQGFAAITKYSGAAAELTVPSTLGGFAVEYIGDNAFAYCYGLTAAVLPDSVVDMGNNVFYACMNLADVTLPSGIADIGNGLFMNCRALKSVILPAGLTSIKTGMFEQCDSLEAAVIPNMAASIGELAFHSCLSLKEVTVPPSVMSIADNAFSSCPLLLLRVTAQSYAHQYAVSKGVPFTIIQ